MECLGCRSGCLHNSGCPPSRLLFECTPRIITCSSKGSPSDEEVEASSPAGSLQPVTTSKRQEINDKVSDFYNTLSKYAASNRLNPAHVTQHAFGGELKGAKLNYWKCFQMIRGMARSDRKFIFRLCTYRIIEQNYRSVVVWDDALSKLVGQDAPA